MPDNNAEEMRVWVGCLGCYNNGTLSGKWFDAIDAPTTMEEFHQHTHTACKPSVCLHFEEAHEELWVFDHENFGGLLRGECSPMEAKRIAELVDGVDNLDAFRAWIGYESRELDESAIEEFQDAFCGWYEREEDYAYELAEETGHFDGSELWPFNCIDWSKAWRELNYGGDSFSVDAGAPTYGVYIFRNN